MRKIHKIWPIASALSLGLVFALLGGAPAWAYSSPAQGEPPLVAWYWSANNGAINFVYGTDSIPFPMPAVSSTTTANWSGGDNPDPLLWYAQHVNKTWAGTAFAGKYSAPLMTVMNTEHFNPAMVGGLTVAGLTTPTNSTWSYADSWIYPNGVNAAAVLKMQGPQVSLTGTTVSNLPRSSSSPAPTSSHSSTPTSSTQTPPSSSTPATSTPVTHHVTPTSSPPVHSSAPAPSHPAVIPTKPIEPPHQARTSYHHYRLALASESQQGPSPTPWPWFGLGIIVVGGGIGIWQWRRHRG